MSTATQRRRRVLLLTPRWPYPVIGGDLLRIWHLAQELSRHHDLTLLSLCDSAAQLHAEVPDDGVFRAVHRVLHPRWRTALNLLRALPGSEPLQVAYYRNPAFRERLRSLAPQHDVVWCHLVRMAPYAMVCPQSRWIEMTDAISMGMARVADSGLPAWSVRRWLYQLEARRLRPLEQSMPRHFDLVSLIARPDAAHLWGADPARWPAAVRLVPNGTTAVRTPPTPAGHRAPSIAFVGQMRSLANQDALEFLLTDVLPRVRRAVPAVQVHVVGPCPPELQRRWSGLSGVRLHGVVADLASVLGHCRVGACPVRIGAGMQNKLLDYLAHGMAAVTSPVGLEGLNLVPEQELLLANHAEEWAAQLTRLLTDDALASRVGTQGWEAVRDRHTWSHALAPWTQAVRDSA